jgi:hypothetical protein
MYGHKENWELPIMADDHSFCCCWRAFVLGEATFLLSYLSCPGTDIKLSSIQSPSLCNSCGIIKSAFVCVCMNFLNNCYEISLGRHAIGNFSNFVRFEVLMVVNLHIWCFWVIAPCS